MSKCLAIFIMMRVQKVHGYPMTVNTRHLRLPDMGVQGGAIKRKRYAHTGIDKVVVRVYSRIRLRLHAVFIELLPTVTLPVQQCHADQREVGISRCLDVITGQHAQST